MHRHLCHAFSAAFLFIGPAWGDSCSLNSGKQIQMLAPDCAVLSAFGASFGQRGLTAESLVLNSRRVDFRFHNPESDYEYDLFLADDDTARQLTADHDAFDAVRVDFQTVLAKHICQIAGAANAVRDGATFDFGILFHLSGEPRAAVERLRSRNASVFIHTCEAL
jgi:hypothetical protein